MSLDHISMFSDGVSATNELTLLETTPITAKSTMLRPNDIIEVSPDITWTSHDLTLDDVRPDILGLLECGNSSCVQSLVRVLSQLMEDDLKTLTDEILQVASAKVVYLLCHSVAYHMVT